MLTRMIRAAAFDPSLYEEVEHDGDATGQALLIVVLAAVAAGIGGLLRADLGGLIAEIIWGLVGFLLFTLFVYWVGTAFFRTPQTSATWGQVVRTVGFANTPSLLSIITFIPVLGWIIAFIIPIWVLIAATIGVRAALDFPITNAFATVIVGWLIWFLVRIILQAIV